MTQHQLREQVTAAANDLKAVKRGEIYEAARVRAVLRECRRLETRLDRLLRILYDRRRAAEKAFVEGWREHPFCE